MSAPAERALGIEHAVADFTWHDLLRVAGAIHHRRGNAVTDIKVEITRPDRVVRLLELLRHGTGHDRVFDPHGQVAERQCQPIAQLVRRDVEDRIVALGGVEAGQRHRNLFERRAKALHAVLQPVDGPVEGRGDLIRVSPVLERDALGKSQFAGDGAYADINAVVGDLYGSDEPIVTQCNEGARTTLIGRGPTCLGDDVLAHELGDDARDAGRRKPGILGNFRPERAGEQPDPVEDSCARFLTTTSLTHLLPPARFSLLLNVTLVNPPKSRRVNKKHRNGRSGAGLSGLWQHALRDHNPRRLQAASSSATSFCIRREKTRKVAVALMDLR